MKDQHELESAVKQRLEEIKLVPPRDPQAATRVRAHFLNQAVSVSELPRQKGWMSIFRKEQFAMNVLLSIFVITGLLFGGGATVRAAQDDLPNEPLYAVKMWSEDLSLRFQNTPEAKVDRLMELAQARIQEMERLTDGSKAVPDQVRLRLEQHIQQTLQTCLMMDDPTLGHTLLQVRDRLQDRDRDLERLQLHTQSQDQLQLLTQARTMLRERLRLVEDGLINHEMFRERVRNGFRFGQDDNLSPPVQNGNGQKNGQPTSGPSGPNANPGGTSTGPGEPNTNPGGPNTDPGGPNTDPGGNMNGSGSGAGGNNNDAGGNEYSGNDGSGSGGSGGSGSGGNGNGGTDTGGNGSGSGSGGGNK